VFWRCGQALNPPKDIFSIRIRPLDLGEYILSQKLLVDIDFDKFASKTGHHGVMLATLLFCPFAVVSVSEACTILIHKSQ
jgi:cyanate lyase